MESKIFTNSKNTLIRQIISILIQFMSIVLIARQLGVEGNGIYSLAILLPAFMSIILALGLNSSNIFFIGKKEYKINVIYTTAIVMSIAIIVVGIIIGLSFILLFSNDVFPRVSIHILIISLFRFPFLYITTLNLSFLKAIENFDDFNIVSLFSPIAFLTFILLSLIYENFCLQNLIIISLLNPILSMMISSIYTYKNKYRFSFRYFSKSYMLTSLSYGLRSHASNLIAFVNYRADLLILNLLSNTFAVGIYSLAVQIAERLWIVSGSMSTVLLPRFVALNSYNEKRVPLILKSYRIVTLLTIILSFILVITSSFLIELLFGNDYNDVVKVLPYLMPGIVLGAGSQILANAIAALGKPELNLYTSIIAMITNIILNIVLIPNYGFMGAAIATSLSYSINSLLKVILFMNIEREVSIQEFIFKVSDLKYLYSKLFTTHK
tara:strand:+ start:2541 stop:3854 length:1314 start_codon:yes stop_codon:yes gene_type:complete